MLTIENSIKASNKLKWLKRTLISISSFISIIVIVFIGWSISEVKSQDPFIPQNVISKTINKTIESFSRFRFPIKRVMGFNSDFPTFNLDIKLKNYAELEKISNNNGNGRRETYVSASIRTDNKSVKAKIRLQGDREIHWADPERWSFRVEVKDDTLLGMRKFSIQHPVTRNYIYEWIFHDFLKREGLIGLNYQFISLNVNGKSRGVYAAEEKSDKLLIESNKRRDGPIFKFTFNDGMNANNFWDNIKVSPYQKKQWSEKNPILLAQASDLLRRFINGDLNVDEVFDTDKLARFFAIADLFSMLHGTIPDGIRLYFNPISQMFEPIGNDGHFLDKDYPVLVSQLKDFRGEDGFWSYGPWYERLFSIEDNNSVLYEKYIQELNRLSSFGYIEDYLDDVNITINNNLDFIYSDFPYADLWSSHPLTGLSPLFYYDEDKILNKRDAIKLRLKLTAPIYIKDIQYDGETLSLDINNKAKLPVKVVQVELDNKSFQPLFNKYIYGISNNQLNKSNIINFVNDDLGNSTSPGDQLIGKIKYSVIGMPNVHEQNFFFGGKSLGEMKAGNINKFKFLQIDNYDIYLGPGNIVLNEDLIVPKMYQLHVLPGTNIDLVASSKIISYSPINMKGDSNNMIKIHSSDNSGEGILVIKASGQSFMDFVDFRGQNIMNTSQTLSSVLTFYESDVIIENSLFSKNLAEDVINIIRSEFSIDNITIKDSLSDGIDLDFSNGSILNSDFYNIGNDSIDLSGSTVELSQINSYNSGDKAVSIGEGSFVYASGININNSRIGFAIKDSSYLQLLESSIKDSEIGFTVFQKKQEFQSPKADIWRYTSKNVNQEYLLEEGSVLLFDGVKVKPNASSLREDLY